MAVALLGLALLGLAVSAGCFRASVKGPRMVYPTAAEEIRDLKKARDAGAITPQEYQVLVRKLSASSQPARLEGR